MASATLPLPMELRHGSPATKQDVLPSTPVIDGFMYNPAICYWPNTYNPLALTNTGMEILRRANLLRARQYALPDTQGSPIRPRETYEIQIQVTAGSYIWGLQFVEYHENDEEVLVPASADRGMFNIVDGCTGVAVVSDFVFGKGVGSYGTQGARSMVTPFILPQPRIITSPGLVNVEIANTSDEDLTCQLVIFTAEPCVEVKSSGRSQYQPQVAAPIPGTFQGAATLTGNRQTLTFPGAPAGPGMKWSPVAPGYVAAPPEQIAAQGGNPAGQIPGQLSPGSVVLGQVYRDEAGNMFYWAYDDAGRPVRAYFPLPQNPVTQYFD